MTVYFVCRCHYDLPTCLHVKRFKAKSVLDWFQQNWTPIANEEEAYRHAEELLDYRVYSFGSFFTEIAERKADRPKTLKEAAVLLEEAVYCEEVIVKQGTIQVLTDDDDLELAYYIFDDEFARKHPEKVSILIREEWLLPTDWTEGEFTPIRESKVLKSEKGHGGNLWMADLVYFDSYSLSELADCGGEDYLLKDCRIPDLPRVLLGSKWEEGDDPNLGSLRDSLIPMPDDLTMEEQGFYQEIAKNPYDLTNWDVYSDWLLDHGQTPSTVLLQRGFTHYCDKESVRAPEDEKRSLIQVDEHVAQMCLHGDRFLWPMRTVDLYQRGFFFDDWWAAANPDLANSILHCASRWDVLS